MYVTERVLKCSDFETAKIVDLSAYSQKTNLQPLKTVLDIYQQLYKNIEKN